MENARVHRRLAERREGNTVFVDCVECGGRFNALLFVRLIFMDWILTVKNANIKPFEKIQLHDLFMYYMRAYTQKYPDHH